ncbi:MAG: helix-turn-helix domain-containing protein [Gammaproteobacteria bacterium]
MIEAMIQQHPGQVYRIDNLGCQNLLAMNSFKKCVSLMKHHWPGNVRELQNVIERAVILSTDGVLRVPLPELESTPRASSAAPSGLRTLEEVERDHILQALRETDWVIGGPDGAAERLGLKSTLRPRMEKLGISRKTR